MHRRSLAAGLAGTVLLTGALALAPTAGADEAAPSAVPTLSLQGSDKVVALAYGRRVYTDLGLRFAADGAPFELHAHRDSWDDGIRVEWLQGEGIEPVELPADSMSTFAGLDDFVNITITRVGDAQPLRDLSMSSCFNSYSTTRSHPDAPGRSPYPTGCPWNPYTVGSVMGIQEGWSTSVLGGEYGSSMRIPVGKYDVTASIDPDLASFFGMAPEDSTVETRLVVKKGNSQRPAPPADGGTTLAPSAAGEPTTAAAGEIPETAPDLQSLPAFDINLDGRGRNLRFAATVWNGGAGPMVVDGFREAGQDHMDAYQYFYDADGEEIPGAYQLVGEFQFHGANHQHWHFEDFAGYRLLQDDNGVPGALAVRSTKASFCLANTDAVDYTVPNADWQPENTDLSSACGGPEAMGLREVLSNGSGDTYMQYRAGQAFRVGNLPDGTYWIAVEANPDDEVNGRNLVELNYDNNDSYRKVELGTRKKSGERFVKVEKVGIIDEYLPRYY